MNITMENMKKERIADYAELYMSVFNAPPWNDSWSSETAHRRVSEMISTDTFIGITIIIARVESK